MNALKTFCLVATLVAVAYAMPNQQGNSASNSLKPSQWLQPSQLEALPSLEEITLEQLENMSVKEGEKLVEKLYHLSQINHNLEPSFVPSPSNIPTYIFKRNGQYETVNLIEMVNTLKQWPNFGEEEVTIVITGLPQTSQTIKKANRALVQAYMQRYNGKWQAQFEGKNEYNNEQRDKTSSEENENETEASEKTSTGIVVMIDLGATLTNFKRIALLDVEETGKMIAKVMVQMTNQADVPHEIIHIVGQGIAAHVAGAAGRQFTRLTGHQLRRITGLDPSKVFAKHPTVLCGLARGDAEFVDVIHTSTCGMGTRRRAGDVDFYVNGPAGELPGVNNIIEATMRATRYYAETVRPGNERNFPAVAANSLQQYKNNNGNGKRVYMGMNADYDLQGDYILEVNAKSPFGRATPAKKQNTYHGVHNAWKSQDNE